MLKWIFGHDIRVPWNGHCETFDIHCSLKWTLRDIRYSFSIDTKYNMHFPIPVAVARGVFCGWRKMFGWLLTWSAINAERSKQCLQRRSNSFLYRITNERHHNKSYYKEKQATLWYFLKVQSVVFFSYTGKCALQAQVFNSPQ